VNLLSIGAFLGILVIAALLAAAAVYGLPRFGGVAMSRQRALEILVNSLVAAVMLTVGRGIFAQSKTPLSFWEVVWLIGVLDLLRGCVQVDRETHRIPLDLLAAVNLVSLAGALILRGPAEVAQEMLVVTFFWGIPFALGLLLYRSDTAFGLGDVLMAYPIGVWLSPVGNGLFFLLVIFIAGFLSVGLLLRGFSRTHTFPLGPVIHLAALASLTVLT
jgi:hypothetical protein